MIIITDPRCTEYRTLGHPEKPTRVSRTVDALRNQKVLSIEWVEPELAQDTQLLRAHPQSHLDRLRVPQDFDGDTTAHPGIDEHARRSVAGGLRAVEVARRGEIPFSLLRPPGHHATKNQAMGFCYLSSMAIAVLEALATGSKRVAVLDFDVHHGNGTEDVLRDQPGALFCSIHQHPCYPGTGTTNIGSNCFNYPLVPATPRANWMRTILQALERIAAFKPDLIGVSAGFDAYARDPLANGTLEKEDFRSIGAELRKLSIPTFSILEGGYSVDLPELILHYLLGLAGK